MHRARSSVTELNMLKRFRNTYLIDSLFINADYDLKEICNCSIHFSMKSRSGIIRSHLAERNQFGERFRNDHKRMAFFLLLTVLSSNIEY